MKVKINWLKTSDLNFRKRLEALRLLIKWEPVLAVTEPNKKTTEQLEEKYDNLLAQIGIKRLDKISIAPISGFYQVIDKKLFTLAILKHGIDFKEVGYCVFNRLC